MNSTAGQIATSKYSKQGPKPLAPGGTSPAPGMTFDTALLMPGGRPFQEPVRIYTGLLGQVGDIIMFTATARRIKEIFPNASLTFAVSQKYREAGRLVEGLPYIDRLFVTQNYFDRQTELKSGPWHLGWPVDLRGEDEAEEQRRHNIALETSRRKSSQFVEYDSGTRSFRPGN